MRILVCSDSHGRADQLMLAAEQQPTAEILVFLGDGAADANCFLSLARLGRQSYCVRGNCDGASPLPLWEEFTVQGKTVLCTHGHRSYVKYSLDDLLHTGKERGASLVLYGHTHVPRVEYLDEIYLFNPGSIHEGDYGFVDITEAGIVCRNMKVRRYF